MNKNFELARQLVRAAKSALKRNDNVVARGLAKRAYAFDNRNIDALLILGGLSSPSQSLLFIQKALDLNPQNPLAIEAMQWAQERLQKFQGQLTRPVMVSTGNQRTTPIAILPQPVIKPKPRLAWVYALLSIMLVLGLLWGTGILNPVQQVASMRNLKFSSLVGAFFPSPTATATQTPTPTSTSTNTPTPTATSTFTPTPTATATATSTPTSTNTPLPTATNTYAPEPTEEAYVWPTVDYSGEKWIDIDLSAQMLYAYQGSTLIDSFLVSTGTYATPTVTGQYHIYVKYEYTDMSGPGYYLPDVPYTMYFYSGYGIHGTYWHNNFGTPMSHGCVNMRTSDAQWLFYWSYVGMLVNIHY